MPDKEIFCLNICSNSFLLKLFGNIDKVTYTHFSKEKTLKDKNIFGET